MIPHNRPTLGHAEREAAARVLASGWVAQGHEVEAFENEVCNYLGLGNSHAVALSSGTAALFMALWVLRAQGKRVAIPVYSCAAVRNAVVMAGCEPVPIDVGRDTPNIDLDQAVGSRAEVIIAAHLFGVPGRLDVGGVKIPIIEDCAQAFGARIDGRAVGLSGVVGVYSFYATKMFTSGGQGGMLVSPDRSLIDAVRDYREFDSRRDRRPRFNFQMTDLQAAVGRVQLTQIDRFISARRQTYCAYAAAGLPLWPGFDAAGIEPCHYRAIIRNRDPETAIAHFERCGVRAIVPIADWELLAEPGDYPRAHSLARSTISIPVHPALTVDETAHIIGAAPMHRSHAEQRTS